MPGSGSRPITESSRPGYGHNMVITDPVAVPAPPLLARLWQSIAGLAAPDRIDWAIAAACFAAFTVPVLLGAGSAGQAGPAAAFGAIAAAPLIVRRRWPVAVVFVVAAVYVAAALASVAFTPFISNAGPNLAIAVFTSADRSSRRWSLTAAAVAAVATWASLPLAIHLHPRTDQDAVQFFAVIGAWLAGDMVRALRGYRQQVQLMQRRRAVEELQLARAEERLRLSREVHDVVSHGLSFHRSPGWRRTAGIRRAARPGGRRPGGDRDGQPGRARRAAQAPPADPRRAGHRRGRHARAV